MLGIVFALRREVRRLKPGAAVVVGGPGRLNAARAAERLAARGPLSGLISAGFAGALSPSLRVGDLVVNTDVPEWQALARSRSVAVGRIVTVDRVIRTAAGRAQLAERTGGLAADMESAAVAEVAARHGLPFAAVRAITDTAARDLLLDWDRCRRPDGRFHLLTLLYRALRTPQGLAEIRQLWYASRLASQNLGYFLREFLAANGRCRTQQRARS